MTIEAPGQTIIQQIHFEGHPKVASIQVASAHRGYRVRVVHHDGTVDVHGAINADGACNLGNWLHDQIDGEARVARLSRIMEALRMGG